MTFRLRQAILATAFSASVLSLSGVPGTADTDTPPTVISPITTMPSPTPISAPADAATSTPSASPQTPIPDTPTPVSPTPVSPAPVSPAPVSPTPVSPTPVSPAPVSPTPVSPAPVSPAPVSPAPVSPAPVPTETPAYHFIYTPPSPEAVSAPTPPGTPQILEIDLTDKTIITPQLVHMRVVTTREVSSVRIAAMGHTLALSQLAPGEFTAQQQLPKMPFFFRNRTVRLQVVAEVDGGRNSAVTIPVILR